MRGAAFMLGVLLLVPSACSLAFMTNGLGLSGSLRLMFEPDAYGAAALLIWGGSFVLAAIGVYLIFSDSRPRSPRAPDHFDGNRRP